MKYSFFLMIFCAFYFGGYSQKPIIDYIAIKNWPSIDNLNVSSNGKFFYYFFTSPLEGKKLIIETIDKSWKEEIPKARSVLFAGNDQYLIFISEQDSIGIFELQAKKIKYISVAKSIKTPKDDGGKWVSWLESNQNHNTLVLWNTLENIFINYEFVKDYYFSDDGKILLLNTISDKNEFVFKWINLEHNSLFEIYRSNVRPQFVTFDKSNSKIIFLVEDSSENSSANKLNIANSTGIIAQIDKNTPGIGPNLEISKWGITFSRDGSQILFNTTKSFNSNSTKKEVASVDVWHYKDKKIQSQQLYEVDKPQECLAAFNLNTKRVNVLTSDDSEKCINIQSVNFNSNYIILRKNFQALTEKQFLPRYGKASLILVSLLDYSRKIIVDKQQIIGGWLSPMGKYVIYYDQKAAQYCSYDINSNRCKYITNNVSERLYNLEHKNGGFSPSLPAAWNIAGWLPNDEAVLIYDQFDIWKVDTRGLKMPVNITNGYGKKHNVKLRILELWNSDMSVIQLKKNIYLTGTNLNNFDEGFYSIEITRNRDPKLLNVGPYHYYTVSKVNNSHYYLLYRGNQLDAPNWYLTDNFEKFKRLTDLQPHRKFNWYVPELVSWKMLDGKVSKGVLYKPENFDSTKKYPLLILIYESASSTINGYKWPQLSNSTIRVPWATSRGFLVFEPDIQYKKGKTGESAYNSIVSAAKYLSKYSWVDNKRIGLSGSSFGGYEINYILTKTDIFAAAAPGCGMVNLISGYGGLGGWPLGKDGTQHWDFETNQSRIGATLWERPDLYVQNSPIFNANRVLTPVLIMHNKEDAAVPWSQGVEWFLAFRRLGKKAWLLQYDGEGHGLDEEKNKLDFTIRLDQFFNHYLKEQPAPIWMTKGIDALMKGVVNGYDLDSVGFCGYDCKVCKKINSTLK